MARFYAATRDTSHSCAPQARAAKSIAPRIHTARVDLTDLISHAEALAVALLGLPSSRSNCELRYGRKGSLLVHTGGARAGQFYDFEENRGGGLLQLIQLTRGCSNAEAWAWAIREVALESQIPRRALRSRSKSGPVSNDARIRLALQDFESGVNYRGTPVETYFRARKCFTNADLPDVRFNPSCHVRTLSGSSITLPAAVFLHRCVYTDQPKAILRIFLQKDGSGKVDPSEYNIRSAKMMLGPTRGAVIKVSPDVEVGAGLCIAEGVENALTAAAFGFLPIWAAGSAGAIRSLPVLPGIEALTVFADADDEGVGVESARVCAARWHSAGREVFIRIPPRGLDWNDVCREILS